MNANSETTTSGGSAAQTTSTNPNPKTDPPPQIKNQSHKPEAGENLIQLKHAATKCECAASSLKYNVRNDKLRAFQENAMAPYMVYLPDVERFLRETPGVASKFYPKSKPPEEIKDGPSLTGLSDEPVDKNPPSSPVPSGESEATLAADNKPETTPPAVQTTQAPVEAAIKTGKPANGAVDHKPATSVPDAQADPSTQVPADATKRRRRRRRRGKGGGGNPLAATEVQSLALKALTGTTPKERLRITACLNELAGLVASV